MENGGVQMISKVVQKSTELVQKFPIKKFEFYKIVGELSLLMREGVRYKKFEKWYKTVQN